MGVSTTVVQMTLQAIADSGSDAADYDFETMQATDLCNVYSWDDLQILDWIRSDPDLKNLNVTYPDGWRDAFDRGYRERILEIESELEEYGNDDEDDELCGFHVIDPDDTESDL